MESIPIATADLVATGVFPSVTPSVRHDLLAADRTLRALQQKLASQCEASWSTDGVCVDVLPSGQVAVQAPVESDDVSFVLDLYSEEEREWTISADVRVQSDAPIDSGQDVAAEIVFSTAGTPEDAAAAFSAAAIELSRAALSRAPRADAWRKGRNEAS